MTKRVLAMTLASVFAMAATGVMADAPAPRPVSKAVQISEVELDQITAGSATSILALANPGNRTVVKVNNNHTTLINLVPLDVDHATGTVTIVTGNGRVMTRIIGGPR